MKNIIPAIKGTRDFYPEEMALRTWLYNTIRKVSEAYGYQEYEGPFLETIELYAAKSGEELVKEQSFVFPDRGGELITLRPELTPTLARMVAQRQKQLHYPLRWWSFGPFWRYERPQKGRSREFFQWNIDLIGVDSPEADAELISIIASFFKETGISPDIAKIAINDRQLIETELANLDIPLNKRSLVYRLIDRKEKMKPAEWQQYALDLGISKIQLESIQSILTNNELWKNSTNLQRVFSALETFNVKEYTQYVPNIVRGLDYYTGTVFEAQETSGNIRRSILGGGRYDNLLADVGGEKMPAVGFAMGDVVISMVLQNHGLIPRELGNLPSNVLVTIFDENHALAAIKLSTELRNSGLNVILYPDATPLGKQLKYADHLGIKLVVILGPDEEACGKISIKELYSGRQHNIDRIQAIDCIKQLLEYDIAS